MKKILVTGANGQLGRCLKDASLAYPEATFHFVDRSVLDIAKDSSVKQFFSNNSLTIVLIQRPIRTWKRPKVRRTLLLQRMQ